MEEKTAMEYTFTDPSDLEIFLCSVLSFDLKPPKFLLSDKERCIVVG